MRLCPMKTGEDRNCDGDNCEWWCLNGDELNGSCAVFSCANSLMILAQEARGRC
jgi:hypothetical protein